MLPQFHLLLTLPLLVFLLTCDGVLVVTSGAAFTADSNLPSTSDASLQQTSSSSSSVAAYTIPFETANALNGGGGELSDATTQLLERLKSSSVSSNSAAWSNLLQIMNELKIRSAASGEQQSSSAENNNNAKMQIAPPPLLLFDGSSPTTPPPAASPGGMLDYNQILTLPLLSDQFERQQRSPGIPPPNKRQHDQPAASTTSVQASSSWSPSVAPPSTTTNLVFVISPDMAARTIKTLMGSLAEELAPGSTSVRSTANTPVQQFMMSSIPQYAPPPPPQPHQPTNMFAAPPSFTMSTEYMKETVLPWLGAMAATRAAVSNMENSAAAAAMPGRGGAINGGVASGGSTSLPTPYVDPVALQLMAATQQHMNRQGWHNPQQHAMVNQFMSPMQPQSTAGGNMYTSMGAGLGVPASHGTRVGGVADIGGFLGQVLHGSGAGAASNTPSIAVAASSEQAS